MLGSSDSKTILYRFNSKIQSVEQLVSVVDYTSILGFAVSRNFTHAYVYGQNSDKYEITAVTHLNGTSNHKVLEPVVVCSLTSGSTSSPPGQSAGPPAATSGEQVGGIGGFLSFIFFSL